MWACTHRRPIMPRPSSLAQVLQKHYYALSLTLFAPTVLLLVVWCLTLKWELVIADWRPSILNSVPILNRYFWHITDGFVYVDSGHGRFGAPEFDDQVKAFFPVPYIGGLGGGSFVAYIPFWLLFCIYSIPATLLWVYMRGMNMRAMRGCCRKCRYNLRGVVSPVCPECGTLIPEEARDHLASPAEEE